MPFQFAAVELHEAALFQRRQQAVYGRGRQPRANGKIAKPVALVVFGQYFNDRERAVDRLHAAVPRLGITVGAGFRLDRFAPDHVSLHRDLHSCVKSDCQRVISLLLPFPVLHGER